MTPDTAALRALADDAPSGPPRAVRIAATIGNAATGVESAYLIGIDVGTVRALCDAADEVERLRAAVVERDTRLAETIRYHDARVNRADEATDASRTAHAALIADLRALRPVQHVCSDGVWLRYADVRDLADRHAPTTGATP